jgi:molybdate transport system substrate-binding protein
MKSLAWTLMWACALSAGHAGEVRVAVAANFAAPMQKIAQSFEKDTGHRALLAWGSTGAFHVQIKNGAPFEVLLAADQQTPLQLEQEGWVVSGSRFNYATGKLVLYSKQKGLVDDQGRVLQSQSVGRLAIANPQTAPYGAAALETLKALNLLTFWQPRLVQADNIAQAFQFVSTENASLGFVAMSQVHENGQLKEGSAWVVPQGLYTPIHQDAALLNKGKGNLAAQALLQYLRSEKTKRLIRSFGYDV